MKDIDKTVIMESPSLGGVGEELGEAPKILVIQQKMIGDVLVSSLICENLKLNYPEAEVHYLVNRFTIPVIENNPYIDKIVVFEDSFRSSKIELYRFLKSIGKSNYDVVIDAYGKLESNLVTMFSGAKTKISWKKSYTKFIYTKVLNKLNKAETNVGLAIEDRLNLLSVFNLKKKLRKRPKIYLTLQEKDNAKQILNDFKINLSKPIFMISVLGSDPSKTYPFKYMAEVLDYVVENANAQLVFNYVPNQKEHAITIFNLCNDTTQKKIHLNLTPHSIRDFIAITSFCDALIGNEGGAVNMAKAIKVPTFTIFSPWIDKKAWASFEDGKKHVSIHLEDFHPGYYKNAIYKDLKPKSEELYIMLKPEFIFQKLKKFLQLV